MDQHMDQHMDQRMDPRIEELNKEWDDIDNKRNAIILEEEKGSINLDKADMLLELLNQQQNSIVREIKEINDHTYMETGNEDQYPEVRQVQKPELTGEMDPMLVVKILEYERKKSKKKTQKPFQQDHNRDRSSVEQMKIIIEEANKLKIKEELERAEERARAEERVQKTALRQREEQKKKKERKKRNMKSRSNSVPPPRKGKGITKKKRKTNKKKRKSNKKKRKPKKKRNKTKKSKK